MADENSSRADQYVDDAWKANATEEEAKSGVSGNVSLHSFPPSYRLGQPSPTIGTAQGRPYALPYRGGASVAHGVGQLFDPGPVDMPLEEIPSADGPAIGGQPADPAMPFPDPIPVQVVSMPQLNNIPMQRDGQVRLPPREGRDAIPRVQNVLSREQNRTAAYFASDNHEEDDPNTPYCVHLTFQRDIGNFIFDPDRPAASWGIPLQSNGQWFGSFKHTEGMYGFNTESFEVTEFERYLTVPKYLKLGLWRLDGMDADTYLKMTDPQEISTRALSQHVKSSLDRMDFLALVEAQKWRTLHFSLEYSSQVG